MVQKEVAVPEVVSRDEWIAVRRALLTQEKTLTREQDRLSAARRRLPMVKIEKEYVFEGPDGKRTLSDLFEGRHQLIVYHFMFDPEWDAGCTGCTSYINALGDLSDLGRRDTGFVIISRAPLPKLEAYKAAQDWQVPWCSSFGSDFNYDFHVTLDAAIAAPEYNYAATSRTGEEPGLSVFFRSGKTVFHTYSTFARGGEKLTDTYSLLDVTPYGRQEDWESSPPGWPQKPTYG